MPDYEKLYHIMFNAATDAEKLLAQANEVITIKHLVRADETLKEAQRLCEELYVGGGEYAPGG
jgi:hypothetical protein